MQLSKADIKKYPKFARYVSLKMPEVAHEAKIVNTIQSLSGSITKAKIKQALEWGKGPMVKVADLDAHTNGEFTPDSGSNEIRISRKRVEQFEAGKGLERTAYGRLVYV